MNCLLPSLHKFKRYYLSKTLYSLRKCRKCNYIVNYKDDKVSEEDFELLHSPKPISIMSEMEEVRKQVLPQLGISRDELKILYKNVGMSDTDVLLLMISRINKRLGILGGK